MVPERLVEMFDKLAKRDKVSRKSIIERCVKLGLPYYKADKTIDVRVSEIEKTLARVERIANRLDRWYMDNVRG